MTHLHTVGNCPPYERWIDLIGWWLCTGQSLVKPWSLLQMLPLEGVCRPLSEAEKMEHKRRGSFLSGVNILQCANCACLRTNRVLVLLLGFRLWSVRDWTLDFTLVERDFLKISFWKNFYTETGFTKLPRTHSVVQAGLELAIILSQPHMQVGL